MKNPNKLDYFTQLTPNKNSLLLRYYFMGIQHAYEIKDI